MSKFAFISGASAGIGEATARALAREGWGLVLGARRLNLLQRLCKELQEIGSPATLALELDVSDQNSVERFCLKGLEFTQGRVEALVNNAGLALGVDHLKDGQVGEWETVIDTNVTGVLRLTRALLPQMVDNQYGHIVFLSSIAAHQVYEGGAVYCATKHAIKAVAKTLRLELNGLPIRVSTIDPGMVETEFSVVRHRGNRSKADQTYQDMTPLTADDVAECISFVLSRAPHINIDQLLIMPTDQASVYRVNRKPSTC